MQAPSPSAAISTNRQSGPCYAENAGYVTVMLDGSCCIGFCSSSVEHTFGYDPLALFGQHISTLLPDLAVPLGCAGDINPSQLAMLRLSRIVLNARHASGSLCSVVVSLLEGDGSHRSLLRIRTLGQSPKDHPSLVYA